MNTTSLSLLDRLKHARPDAVEWRRLQDIYLPLIRQWLSRHPELRDGKEKGVRKKRKGCQEPFFSRRNGFRREFHQNPRKLVTLYASDYSCSTCTEMHNNE